jgi:hypothetical protein
VYVLHEKSLTPFSKRGRKRREEEGGQPMQIFFSVEIFTERSEWFLLILTVMEKTKYDF